VSKTSLNLLLTVVALFLSTLQHGDRLSDHGTFCADVFACLGRVVPHSCPPLSVVVLHVRDAQLGRPEPDLLCHVDSLAGLAAAHGAPFGETHMALICCAYLL
jgi:hypothetical protein